MYPTYTITLYHFVPEQVQDTSVLVAAKRVWKQWRVSDAT
jgi:hypothetical protein